MFSRYNNIVIPKNYNGNRFREIEDTEMKTHKAYESSIKQVTTKTSSSPSFQSLIDQKANENEDFTKEEDEEKYQNIDTVSTENELSPNDTRPNNQSKYTTTPYQESGLSKLISDIKGDDLLLIALILLLAEGEREGNQELIVLLALLLLRR